MEYFALCVFKHLCKEFYTHETNRGQDKIKKVCMISNLLSFDRENVNIPSNIHTFRIISQVLPVACLLGFPSEQSE